MALAMSTRILALSCGAMLFALGSLLTNAQVPALTVGMVADHLHSLINDINRAGSDLIEQGNNAAAEQQFLLAGLLQGTLEQIERVYGNQMRSTVESIGGIEKDAFLSLNKSLDKVNALETKTASDMQALIQQSQSAGNQLLSALPLTKRYPVFSGVQTRDVLAEFNENPADVKIVGFWLIDPELKIPPVISVVATSGPEVAIPAGSLSPYFDHIDVQLPDSLKQTLRFQNSPCEPRKTFRVKVKIFYLPAQPWWKLGFGKEPQPLERTFNVLAGNEYFSASITASGETVSVSDVDTPFSEMSPNIQWSCEENKTQIASFTLPDGATLLSKNADWGEIGGRWENQGCSVATAGKSVTASCSVRGGNKEGAFGVYNCPGGGHGKARVFGTYRRQNRTITPFSNLTIGTLILSNKSGGSSFVTLPQRANSTYSTVNLNIYRSTKQASCTTVYDQMVLNLPTSANPGTTVIQSVTQTSSKGEFEATADRSQVTVSRILPLSQNN
jgi:hypothetical protein